jgi:hypothetical protein
MFSLYLAMKLLSRYALVGYVAAGLLIATVPSALASGCAFSKLGDTPVTTAGDGSGGWFAASPDSNALGTALGGLGAIAALLTGGTVLVRQRLLAQAPEANATVLDAKSDLGLATETEIVLVSEPGEIETEVALAYRR